MLILLFSHKGQIFLLNKYLYKIKYLVNLTHTHTALDQQYYEDSSSTLCVKLSKQKPHNHFASKGKLQISGAEPILFH